MEMRGKPNKILSSGGRFLKSGNALVNYVFAW